MDGQPVLFGRESERAVLQSFVDRAFGGDPGLLLVHGEAGIGKTSLVRDVAEASRSEASHVLHGLCLRFGADVTSYFPFTRALTHWLGSTTSGLASTLCPSGRFDDLIPALGDEPRGVALLQFGAALEALQADRPTVLAIDDLQWADPSSLDVLSYLVAGFAPGQRLAVFATYRDTDLPVGHRLHGWLADAARMSSVSSLRLGPLDVWSIEEMILSRDGAAADAGRAHEVFRRSDGNPYLAHLLLAEGSDGAGGVASEVSLADALLASWHRLSEQGRAVSQIVAVGGAPVAFEVLRDLSARHGVDAVDTARAVQEAAAQGIAVETESGSIWFRHPLLAEAIAGSLSVWERRQLHTEIADGWASASSVDARDRANALALHHVAAGHHDEAFQWSLRAADEAELVRAWEEVAKHLSTAVSLLTEVSGSVAAEVERGELLLRAARAAEAWGDDRGAVRHYEHALVRVDRSEDPRLAARILLDLHLLRAMAGLGPRQLSLVEPQEALELTDGMVDAPERSLAFAHLAFAEVFNGLPGAGPHADTAMQLAEAVGSPVAMIWALGARSQARFGTPEGVDDAERAMALAKQADDPRLMRLAATFVHNTYESMGLLVELAEVSDGVYRDLLARGLFDYAGVVGANAASGAFDLGRWAEARVMVRELLTLARSHNAAGTTRCVAAMLTAHQGNRQAAALHLRRAEELLPTAAPVGDLLLTAQIQVSIALGLPEDALILIDRFMAEVVALDPRAADYLLVLASRAAALMATTESRLDARRRAVAYLERIEAARGTEPMSFAAAGPRDAAHPAMGAVHAAQRAQCLNELDGLADLWEEACRATERADLRYEHARSLYWLGRHLLTRRADRRRAADVLGRSRRLAEQLGAAPLTEDIDSLAGQAHLTLGSSDPRGAAAGWVTPIVPATPALTPREEEVLEGLVSGETYGQIAARLFISEKTVSSHVSAVLRKTGRQTGSNSRIWHIDVVVALSGGAVDLRGSSPRTEGQVRMRTRCVRRDGEGVGTTPPTEGPSHGRQPDAHKAGLSRGGHRAPPVGNDHTVGSCQTHGRCGGPNHGREFRGRLLPRACWHPNSQSGAGADGSPGVVRSGVLGDAGEGADRTAPSDALGVNSACAAGSARDARLPCGDLLEALSSRRGDPRGFLGALESNVCSMV
ncbi:hypothetical protein N802_14515 [Knoellia sinensis KCTC 19936]|uniref:HTH luxR-type domain-containing protein n=1 Tax=Knoellia sinensis KCTC 19936 TaxID=1385520 RepID=A0A0A0J8B5_9MICO|nr:LuxR family transcriptional regulator [Knoellia sinensis]KGN33403.1 hypothetical protein N802_14515 [Knoellia sinensis KCTC 19936]